jgi:hypothetical protein
MAHEAFVAGDIHTHFLQEHRVQGPAPSIEALVVAASMARQAPAMASAVVAGHDGPWTAAGAWRLG